MQKRKLNNQGFSLVGIIIIILVLVAVGGAGYLVWRKNHDTKKSTTQNSKTDSTSNKGNDGSNSQATTKHTTNEAVSTVQSAYSKALAYVQQTTNADQGELDAIKDYLDPALYAQLTAIEAQGAGHDLILCAQSFPDSVTASQGSSTSDMTTVNVAEAFKSTTNEVIVTVDLTTLKITNITCA